MDKPQDKLPQMNRFRLGKKERLTSRKMIDRLFSEGKSFLVYPVKVIYMEIDKGDLYTAKVVFAVSKKLHKKAVVRNLIKRRMREAYRLSKHRLSPSLSGKATAIAFIYIGKDILQYPPIEKAIKRSLDNLGKAIQNP